MGMAYRPEVLILLSGGIDSAALVAFYSTQQVPLLGLHVDYGQAASVPELNAARSIASHYAVTLQEVQLRGVARKTTGEIRARNLLLLAAATIEAPSSVWGVAIGIHAGTTYKDCSPDFLSLSNEVLKLQSEPVTVLAPFLTWHRSTILAFCREHAVPIHITYSCELGTVPPCGACSSCKDRETLDAGAFPRV